MKRFVFKFDNSTCITYKIKQLTSFIKQLVKSCVTFNTDFILRIPYSNNTYVTTYTDNTIITKDTILPLQTVINVPYLCSVRSGHRHRVAGARTPQEHTLLLSSPWRRRSEQRLCINRCGNFKRYLRGFNSPDDASSNTLNTSSSLIRPTFAAATNAADWLNITDDQSPLELGRFWSNT